MSDTMTIEVTGLHMIFLSTNALQEYHEERFHIFEMFVSQEKKYLFILGDIIQVCSKLSRKERLIVEIELL